MKHIIRPNQENDAISTLFLTTIHVWSSDPFLRQNRLDPKFQLIYYYSTFKESILVQYSWMLNRIGLTSFSRFWTNSRYFNFVAVLSGNVENKRLENNYHKSSAFIHFFYGIWLENVPIDIADLGWCYAVIMWASSVFLLYLLVSLSSVVCAIATETS